jgi:hypothetical protein
MMLGYPLRSDGEPQENLRTLYLEYANSAILSMKSEPRYPISTFIGRVS